MTYAMMTREQQQTLLAQLQEEYAKVKALGLKLDMSRGKPSKAQLDMVSDILHVLNDASDCMDGKLDVRNYGELMGTPSLRVYFADLLGVKVENVFDGGCASLQLMYDLLSKACINGLYHSPKPWAKLDRVKFLCPSPGYDRHFKVCESLGIEMIYIPMTEEGPDMDLVEEAIKDPEVKGMWCVPKYSNPDGIIYSEKTIQRLVNMKPAAPDFAVMWDNAYCVHEFEGEYVYFPNILDIAREAGSEDMFYEFASTSKITFPGSGVSCMVCSEANLKYLQNLLGAEIISYNKVNQLRHARYLKDKAHTLELMKKHAAILGPKFRLVVDTLDKELGELDVAHWSNPKGGYFVSFYGMDGTAKRIYNLMKEAGVVMTAAGAAFPYGKDPHDNHIRIAPSLPPLEELEKAMDVFCLCVKIASLEKLLEA